MDVVSVDKTALVGLSFNVRRKLLKCVTINKLIIMHLATAVEKIE